ncbi:hypothetical protein CIJ84_00785 [Neisseria meningitidis]|uniref:Uncharacterized protein n=1 Tax=Neisseria meningitidis TaxID=487 RepID=A0AB37KFX5_NEIME|nr:hypothetical protein [Neisseria meningitidis]RGA50843.1 hypothetical protein CIJ82_00895 [Neisseria meningitidis]RGA59048.1 hypothetical protein CIJ77_01070 [Neisseria meningitidis]RGA61356.1 hypothetical protein CIJ75_00465 [Neisseria meningitidis]RGA70980.1 hypothetical protein CIJ72_00800 [Neisseria meningitidis]
MRYSKNKDYQIFIRQLVSGGENGCSSPKNGRKHSALKHLLTDRKIPIPGSPGQDPRGLLNFKTMVRHIERGSTLD